MFFTKPAVDNIYSYFNNYIKENCEIDANTQMFDKQIAKMISAQAMSVDKALRL